MRWWLAFAVLACGGAHAAVSAAAVGTAVAHMELDAGECYRVLDLNFAKQDAHIYFTSGWLVFAKPINGITPGAVFSTDIEAGDGELLLMPPTRSERMSLAKFTHMPNLEEHFRTAVMAFTDDTAAQLRAVLERRAARKNPDMGAALAEKWTPVLQNIGNSFQVRLTGDLLSADRANGLFYAGMAGKTLGNFDLLYDPRTTDQVVLGQITEAGAHTGFDVWTEFPGRAARQDRALAPQPAFSLSDYQIEAEIKPDFTVEAHTRVKLHCRDNCGPAIRLLITHAMDVSGAKLDGRAAEVFERESLRSNLIRDDGNGEFLVVSPEPLAAGSDHVLEIEHAGKVILKGANDVFFVGARGTWYPRASHDFTRYELTFRYPADLSVVATGVRATDRTEGYERITKWRTPEPIRFAGFNLGRYQTVALDRGGYHIEVCANRGMLPRPPAPPMLLPVAPPVYRHKDEHPLLPVPLAPLNPAARMRDIAAHVSDALEFYASLFGPAPIQKLTVAPIPGSFGQSFPGLVYLSTLSYMNKADRPAPARGQYQDTFFSEVLDAHEVAHQWWGNLMAPASYHDEWISEGLADYSALMYLEKRKGVQAMDTVLDRYRTSLLEKTTGGATIESAGPIVWGLRLLTSETPDAWRRITYEKGAWIFHMLRRRLGDDNFRAMLREICEQYRFRPFATADLLQVARKYSRGADLNTFFDAWVEGTGIPAVSVTYDVKRTKLSGTVKVSGVADDFSAPVPVEIAQGAHRRVMWVQAGTDGEDFVADVKPGAAAHAFVDTADALITVRK